MTSIFTIADARDEKRNAELPALARAQAQIAERQRIEGILQANPRIGALQGEKGARYYVSFPVYREATDPAALVHP